MHEATKGKASQSTVRFETHKRRHAEIDKGGGQNCPHIVGDPGVAAHSSCSVGQNNPCGHADGGDMSSICAVVEDKGTNRGISEANMVSETRFIFLSGAAIAYMAMVTYKPLPPEVFCTYHTE